MLKKSINPTIVRLFVAVAVLATLTFGVHTASAQSLNPTEVTYDENDDAEVGVYRGSDPQGRTITWSVDGTDADDFEIDEDTGVLTFKSPPDYEMATDRQSDNDPATDDIDETAVEDDNIYEVNVLALGAHQVRLIVTVKDLDEDGTIELSTLQPEEGVSLMGEGLADEDADDAADEGLADDRGPTYQWAASSNGTTWADIEDATNIAYKPVAGDVGKYLRLTATYGDTDVDSDADDVEDGDTSKTASVVSANQVQEHINTNSVPVFPDQDPDEEGVQPEQARDLPEDAEAGDPVGDPVVATDDRGELTYTLSDGDGDDEVHLFTIDRATGQIKVGSADIDFEDSNEDNFTVTVTATDGSGAAPAAVTVDITVTDVNEKPTVTDGDTAVTIAENAADGTDPSKGPTVGRSFLAADEDNIPSGSGTSEMTTWSVSGDDASLFDISDTGQISFKSPPDFEAHATINDAGDELEAILKVKAMATDSRGLSGESAELVVTITNEEEDGEVTLSTQQPQAGIALTASLTDPDNGPVANKAQAELAPTWEWHRAAAVGDGDCPAADAGGWGSAIADADEASYTPDDDADAGMCLRATATYDDGKSGVTEDGEGDNSAGVSANPVLMERSANQAPVFKAPDPDDETKMVTITSAEREVDENSGAGATVGDTVTATDADDGDKPTYSLGGADAASFDIEPGSGQISVSDAAELDYETKATYRVTVTATDGNRASRSIPVTVSLKDLNEAPEVSGPSEVEDYAENGEGEVGAYTATDQDRNVDHDQDDETPTLAEDTVEWSKSGVDEGDFDIGDNGVLSFKSPPDYDDPADSDMDNEYKVMVVATDSAGNKGMQSVTVTVTDKNEPGTVTLSAEQPGVGVQVTASVMDEDAADSDGNATWQWSSSGTADGAFADIDGADKESYTPVDDDAGNYLRATATYGTEDNPRSEDGTSANPVKAYDNVNAAPVFPDQDPDMEESQTDQEREVDENSAAGTPVGDPVMATDSNDIDVLTYTIGEDADDDDATPPTAITSLTIDQATGQISVGDAELNFEADASDATDDVDEIVVMVTATDGSGASASAMVTITVTDLNEAPDVTAPEDADLNTEVDEDATDTDLDIGTYTETDEDGDTISWDVEGPDAAAFKISDAGVLSLKSAPDYEAKGSAAGDNDYKVTVVASDPDGLRDTANVTVTIGNVNEDGTIRLSTLQPQAGVPLTATVTDPDGIKGEVTWTLSGGAADDVTIGSTATTVSFTPSGAGSLTVNAAYEDEEAENQTATYMVPTAYEAVAMQSTNAAPKFADDQDPDTEGDQADAAREVAEGVDAGTNVGNAVTAGDDDTHHADTLTYSLSGPDADSFTIIRGNDVPNSGDVGGQIQVGDDTKLDFESDKKTYMVTVTATDGSGASDSIDVTITVNDVPEPPMLVDTTDPEFASATTTRSVAENTAAGEDIGDPVEATDLDGDTLTYALGGDDAASFDIDEETGQLMTKAELDFETAYSHTVTVTASDGTEEGTDATITVTVMVTNMDEDGTVTLTAEAKVGVDITAMVEDPDGGVTGATWQWASAGDDGQYADIAGATSTTYTPVADDEGKTLQATATYDDAEGSGKSAAGMTTAMVAPAFSAMDYDADDNGEIDIDEVGQAILDFFAPGSTLTAQQVEAVILIYLGL